MADDRYEVAVDIVARRVFCNAVQWTLTGRSEIEADFEITPEIMDDVERRIAQIIGSLDPKPEEFSAGHGYLRGRAAS